VEGESLANDGTALVLFAAAVAAISGGESVAQTAQDVVIAIVGSVGIGLVAGWLATRLLQLVDDHPIELAISIAAAYGTYLLADGLEQSGIIATVVAGLVIGTHGRAVGLSPRALAALDDVWELIAFLLTAFAFLLVGFAISVGDLVAGAVAILWGVIGVLVARAVVVYGLVGGTARLLGERAHWPTPPIGWLHVLFWAGLRGAVAVAMALSLPADFPERALLQQITFGVVLFTLFVQGTTADLVVTRTGVRAGA
jgi:CPA1 family monovalent cation:H+ antiporter